MSKLPAKKLKGKYGAGLRPVHFEYLLKKGSQLDFLELISENYMDTQGRPRHIARKLREKYPMVLHGVSLSIGSDARPNREYLKSLRLLAAELQPELISDHLCFGSAHSLQAHDLLPLPYTQAEIKKVCKNIDYVQNFLGRRILLENVSAYLTWKSNEMTEWEFLATIAEKTGCGILLDINNVYVNSVNFGFDALEYLNYIPSEKVEQIHLAGHTNMKTHLFDTHSSPVHNYVWGLVKETAKKFAHAPICLEWDEEIPHFERVQREVLKAKKIREEAK